MSEYVYKHPYANCVIYTDWLFCVEHDCFYDKYCFICEDRKQQRKKLNRKAANEER